MSKIRICPISRGACGVDIKPDPQKLFVIMPFREEQAPQSLYHDILKALHDWNVSRVDEKYDIPDGLCAICREIQESGCVIADLSGLNHNVFLELGMAFGMGIPCVSLTQNLDELGRVFDLLRIRVITYSRDTHDRSKVHKAKGVETDILKRLNEVRQAQGQFGEKGPLERDTAVATNLDPELRKRIKATLKDLIDMGVISKYGGRLTVRECNTRTRVLISLLHTYPRKMSFRELGSTCGVGFLGDALDRLKEVVVVHEEDVELRSDKIERVLTLVYEGTA